MLNGKVSCTIHSSPPGVWMRLASLTGPHRGLGAPDGRPYPFAFHRPEEEDADTCLCFSLLLGLIFFAFILLLQNDERIGYTTGGISTAARRRRRKRRRTSTFLDRNRPGHPFFASTPTSYVHLAPPLMASLTTLPVSYVCTATMHNT